MTHPPSLYSISLMQQTDLQSIGGLGAAALFGTAAGLVNILVEQRVETVAQGFFEGAYLKFSRSRHQPNSSLSYHSERERKKKGGVRKRRENDGD